MIEECIMFRAKFLNYYPFSLCQKEVGICGYEFVLESKMKEMPGVKCEFCNRIKL